LTAPVATATATLPLHRQRRRGRILIVVAAVAWSTAGIGQRELTLDTGTQLAGRALFGFVALFLYVAIMQRGDVVAGFRAIGRGGLLVAGLMAVASASFIVALNHATVANVLFFQALAPIMAAALGTVVLREAVGRRTWLATIIALAGVALMVGGPGRPSLLGELLSFVMTLSFAGTLVVTRHRRDVSMAPATCISQLLVLVATAPFAHPGQIGGKDLTLLALLGFCQIGLGLMLLTIGARLIPAAEVALLTQLEVVLAPLWVWLARSERPSAATIAGGGVVLGAVALQALGEPPETAAAPPP
jgi:drug/metabolite transporter (DMT)-like permease